MGMAAAIGQFSGGALIQWNPAGLGWRAIFLLTLPVCAVTLVLGWKVVPETGGGSYVRLDLGGAALISLALAAVVVPLSEGREQGWPGWVFAVLASVPLLIGAFVLVPGPIEPAGGMPLVDLRLLRIPSFAVACSWRRCSSSPPAFICYLACINKKAGVWRRCRSASRSFPTDWACSSGR